MIGHKPTSLAIHLHRDDSGLLLNHLLDLDDALLAKEHLVAHEEGRYAESAALGRLLSIVEQRVFSRLGLYGLDQCCGIPISLLRT